MADSQSKIDAAAEKAYAKAAEKKSSEKVDVKAVEQAVEADKTAPVKAETVARAVAASKPSAPVKAAAKRAPAKKAAAKKAAPKKIAATQAAPAAGTSPITKIKDTIMATAKTAQNTDYTAKAKEMAADVQTRAKAAYDKGAEYAADASEFNKANVEALVASGKILAAGMQDMGRAYVEDVKAAVETVQADVKKVAAVKSPTELFQLQGEIARRNFDAVVAQTSKNAEAMMKLANDAFAPISSRASVAAEKARKAA